MTETPEIEPKNEAQTVAPEGAPEALFIQQYFRWLLTVSVFYRTGPEGDPQVARGNVLYANTAGFMRLYDIQRVHQLAQHQFIDRGIITDGAEVFDVVIDSIGMLGVMTNEQFKEGAIQAPPSDEPKEATDG